jgi:excisionase family DNA binding protein
VSENGIGGRLLFDGLDELLERVAHEAARQALAERGEPSPWLTTDEAADYLRTSADAVKALRKRNAIPFYKTPGGRILFKRSALNAWVEEGR